MSHRARPLRPARRVLPALAVGGIAALAVAAPAMAALPPGGTGAGHGGLVELEGELSGQGTFKILFTGSQAFLTNFPAGSRTGTVHHLTRRGAQSPFFSGTLAYRRGRMQFTLTQLRVRVDFLQGNALAQAFAVNTRPITFPERLVEGAIPNHRSNATNALRRQNHYKCYGIRNYQRRPGPRILATLVDRIRGTRPDRSNQGLHPFTDPLSRRAREVCIPVEKRIGRETSAVLDNHVGTNLVAYHRPATDSVRGSPLRILNQFGHPQVTPGGFTHVLVPSQILVKSGLRTSPAPPRARDAVAGSPDHFACYFAHTGPRQGPRGTITLTDRFERRAQRFFGTRIGDFCNPVDVRFTPNFRGDARGRFQIKYPEANLVSYPLPQILRRSPSVRVVRILNHLQSEDVVLGNPTRLLVPTARRVCTIFSTAGLLPIPIVPVGSPVSAAVGSISKVTYTPLAGEPDGACPT